MTSAPGGEKHLSSLLTHSNALPFSLGVCLHRNVPYLAGSREAEIRVAVRYGGHPLTHPSDVGSEDISYLFLKGLQLLDRKYYLINHQVLWLLPLPTEGSGIKSILASAAVVRAA